MSARKVPEISAASAKPRDAATLVLTRGRGGRAEVLMGRRQPRDRFMPDVYVFPGGRVDPKDAIQPAVSELRADVAAALERTTGRARARALAVAAVRETFEETGLVLGELGELDESDEGEGEGVRPALAHLHYLARAITPAANPIRYHARFFLADAEQLSGALRSNGELLDLAWVSIRAALELNIIDVTQAVLHEVADRLSGRSAAGVPLIHYRGTSQRIRRA